MQHEQIQADLRSGRIGLAQNRLPGHQPHRGRRARRHDRMPPPGLPARYRESGMQALAEGMVAVVTLAGGAGSRWTKGAGVVKALNPFCETGRPPPQLPRGASGQEPRVQPHGRHAAAARLHHQLSHARGHRAIWLAAANNYGYPGPLLLSPGRNIGLRLIPMVRDLRFAWEEMPQQLLDEQAQKVRESLHASADRVGAAGRRGRQLHRQSADAVPASGRPLVRDCQTCCATACWRTCSRSARACTI